MVEQRVEVTGELPSVREARDARGEGSTGTKPTPRRRRVRYVAAAPAIIVDLEFRQRDHAVEAGEHRVLEWIGQRPEPWRDARALLMRKHLFSEAGAGRAEAGALEA
eukprot:5212926-Pleurochrysis_carterae.AAC.1